MAMAVLDVIGALVGVIGIGITIPGLLPDKDEHRRFIRATAGLSSSEGDKTY